MARVLTSSVSGLWTPSADSEREYKPASTPVRPSRYLDDVRVVVTEPFAVAQGRVPLHSQDGAAVRHRDVVDASDAMLGSQHRCRHLHPVFSEKAKDRHHEPQWVTVATKQRPQNLRSASGQP